MQFGVTMFPADFAIGIVELARAVEERGFESLWVPEHTHIPVKRETVWPGGASDPPPEYAHAMDPFVALGAAAAVTSTLKIGTGICLVIQRDPITLAKEVASLDHVSNGRFLFGVGAGWLREEIANHGTNPKTRWRLFGERMRAMNAIWSNDQAEFHGEFVDFDPIWSWPKPVQKPRPPVLLGGDILRNLDRVLDYADEWMPHPDRGEIPLAQRLQDFWQLCESRGRAKLPVSLFGTQPDARQLAAYEQAGVSRCVFRLPAAPRDEVLPALDSISAAVRQLTAA